MAVSEAQLQQLYLAYFGRPADFDGLVYYTSRPELDIWNVATFFSQSPESQALYGTGFNASVINNIYLNLFNRDAEPAGLLYWSQEVASGRLSPAGAAYGILIGAQNDDLVTVNNKLAVSASFTAGLDTSAEITGYSGNTAAANARDFLRTITSDVATVTQAQANIEAIIAGVISTGGAVGTTTTLTANQDTVVGTAGNDLIRGVYGSGAGDTVTAGDSVDGGNGVDTLEVTASGTGASPAAFVVKNVEIVNINDLVGATFNMLSVENSPAINFTGTLEGQTSKVINASLSSVVGISGAGNLTVDYANTTGTADMAQVSLNGAGTSATSRATIDVSDGSTVESVSVATAGTNFVSLNAGSATKVTVTGSGTNNIAIAQIGTTATIDASASTGTNTFALGTTLSNGDVVKGGTGADTASFTAATALGVVTFTGVETLTGTINADVNLGLGSSTGVKTLNVSGSGSLGVTNATAELATVNVTAATDTDNDLSISYATGQTANLTVNMGSTASTAANITYDDMTFTRVGNFSLNGVGTKILTVDDITLDSTATSITVAGGTADMSVDWINAAASTGVTAINVSTSNLLYVDFIDAENSDNVAVNLTVAADASGYVSYVSGDSYSDVSVTVGEDASGSIGWIDTNSGGFGNVSLTVGSGGSGYLGGDNGYNDAGEEGNIGNVALTAASGGSGYLEMYTYSGDIGDVAMNLGANASGYVRVEADSYSGDDAASEDYVGGGNVGNINVSINGADASGDVYVSANDGYSGGGGMVGDVMVDVQGNGASADINIYASGGNGSIGNVSLVAGASASVYFSADSYEDASDTDAGNIGNVGISVGDGGYVSAYMNADGSVGNVAIVGGEDAEVDVTAYGSSGDVGTVTATFGNEADFDGWFSAGSGSVGSASVTVGEDSYVSIGLEGNTATGSISVTAGAGSDVYAYSYASGGNAGAITITGGDTDDDAYVYASGGSIDAINLAGWNGEYYVDAGSVIQGTVITAGKDGGTVNGTQGGDVITGGAGADTLNGAAGADVITGGAGVDTINGGEGADSIDGGAGNDTLNGDNGADSILGGAGNDTINGGAGTDTINGGAGVDTMTGGTEADTFVFTGDNLITATAFASLTTATDVIADFATTSDKLDFTTAGTVANYAENTTYVATFAALMTAADAALDGTVKYYFGTVSLDAGVTTNGYLVYSENGTTALAVIQLTGVTDIAATDIV